MTLVIAPGDTPHVSFQDAYASSCVNAGSPVWDVSLVLMAGCSFGFGNPRTQIYAESTDAVPYLLVFEGQGIALSRRQVMSLPAMGGGLILDEPGEISGRVELQTTDCRVLSTANIGPGVVMITVAGGTLRVESGVDMSAKPRQRGPTRPARIGWPRTAGGGNRPARIVGRPAPSLAPAIRTKPKAATRAT